MGLHDHRSWFDRAVTEAADRAAFAEDELLTDSKQPGLFAWWPMLVIGLGVVATVLLSLLLGWLALQAVLWVLG